MIYHNANRPLVSATDALKPYREPSVSFEFYVISIIYLKFWDKWAIIHIMSIYVVLFISNKIYHVLRKIINISPSEVWNELSNYFDGFYCIAWKSEQWFELYCWLVFHYISF